MTEANSLRRFGPLTRSQFFVTGVDAEIMEKCPDRDLSNVKTLAWLLMAVWLWQAALFTATAHMMLARPGEFRPELFASGVMLASIILLIDSYVIVRTSWSLQGMKELARGGLEIPNTFGARFKNGLFVFLRVLVTIGMAQLLALFFAILVFGKDIQADLDRRYRDANGDLIAKITMQVDNGLGTLIEDQKATATLLAAAVAEEASLRRAAIDPTADDPEVKLALERASQLAARKVDLERELSEAQKFAADELAGVKGSNGNSGKAGEGPVRRAARERVANAQAKLAAAERELTSVEAKVAKARAKASEGSGERREAASNKMAGSTTIREKLEKRLGEIETALADQRSKREQHIRESVEADPSFVGLGNGFLARYQALQRIAKEDQSVVPVILLLDFVLFSIDLAAVLAKLATFIPSTYATLLAAEDLRRAYRTAQGLADDIEEAMRPRRKPEDDATTEIQPDTSSVDASDFPDGSPPPDPFAAAKGNDIQAPKRRGRPRKNYKPDLSPPPDDGDELNGPPV